VGQHFLFVHIPKTAGTSFRLSAQAYFGDDHTFFDYSGESTETSALIRQAIYVKQDPHLLYDQLSKLPCSFLSGHFPTTKYMLLYKTSHIVSFVRDPIRQVLSHYNHYKNYHSYQESLMTFVEDPRFQNLQSRLLSKKPMGLYGFLGITEKYRESLDLFNQLYQTQLPYLHLNRSEKDALEVRKLDVETLQAIEQANARDISFYRRAVAQLAVRQRLQQENKPFTFGCIQEKADSKIVGCAFQVNHDAALIIDIYAKEKYLASVTAKDFKPGLALQGVSRRGYVGFEYQLTKKNIAPEAIRCIVRETGQEIV